MLIFLSCLRQVSIELLCGFAGEVPPPGARNVQTPAILGGVNYTIDGGDPIYLRGNIFLCARSDGQSDRFFSGSVAQLSLYDEALNATSIEVTNLHVLHIGKITTVSKPVASRDI